MFTGFYLDKHSGRKISWVMQLGGADMKVSDSGGDLVCLMTVEIVSFVFV
jgi:hypothetical protein